MDGMAPGLAPSGPWQAVQELARTVGEISFAAAGQTIQTAVVQASAPASRVTLPRVLFILHHERCGAGWIPIRRCDLLVFEPNDSADPDEGQSPSAGALATSSLAAFVRPQ